MIMYSCMYFIVHIYHVPSKTAISIVYSDTMPCRRINRIWHFLCMLILQKKSLAVEDDDETMARSSNSSKCSHRHTKIASGLSELFPNFGTARRPNV